MSVDGSGRDAVKEGVIIRTFKTCGISMELDRSEDALVHCLKRTLTRALTKKKSETDSDSDF
ncbi:hypothetical protein AAVH_18431 [Aphelenchoides avenae]|nr:hypothetical protein AAVH_18431 [Aphelenchus avenae]